MSPWNVQHIYKADYDKIKTLEVELTPGKILFIPAYWWYSIKYYDEATICTFKYRTYMNTVAILPQLFLYFLQRQNVKRSTVKRLDSTKPIGSTDNNNNNSNDNVSALNVNVNSSAANIELSHINALSDTLISNINESEPQPLTHQTNMQTVD